jgi:hypothetical protein
MKRFFSSTFIDWNKVSKSYKGIQINYYSNKHRLDMLWYYGWDCESGCIWDISCIKNIKKN